MSQVEIINVNQTAKAFTPLLLETKSGPQTLIVCTSLAAHSISSWATPIAYNVSKIACNRLVEHLANDHGAQGLHAYALYVDPSSS
jgi:NAD(P)-dependent dehydrogenase (short-subunit alcohol dehydrogenase family)